MEERIKNLLYVILEFICSIILGMIQSMFRNISDRMLGFIFMPFFVWAAYALCYKASGGHLNPILSVASMLRNDKTENYNYWRVLCYIPAQFGGFFLGVLCQLWFDQSAVQLRFPAKPGNSDEYFWSEPTGYEFFVAIVFTLIWLFQTGRNTPVSEDKGTQTFFIAIAYGTLLALGRKLNFGSNITYNVASLNPAYAFAQCFWDAVDTEDGDAFKFFGNLIAAEFVGMGVAVLLYDFIFTKAENREREVAKQ